MLAKAATKENKSTFTSSFNKKTSPEGKLRLKGLEILKKIADYALLEILANKISIVKSQCL